MFFSCLREPLLATFPEAQGYVTDVAGILDAGARSQIQSLLRDTERKTSAEIALVTVVSLDGMTIEEYANRLFRRWGVGKKGQDNGVLVLIAPADRQIRIEVGYGLEPILPDGLAGEIIRTSFVPEFRNGQYARGILQGIRRVADVVEKKQTPSPQANRRRGRPADDRPPAWVMVPFFGSFVGFGAFVAGLGWRTKTTGPMLVAGLFAGIPLLMAVALFSPASIWILGPLAVGMFVWGRSRGQSEYWHKTLRGSPEPGSAASGWVMGGSSSSSSGGGSSGDSFGGGSSGGGGASGRW